MISRTNADHYCWGDGCDGWHLVRQPGLSVIHERMPPGTAEVAHLHRQAHQFFFVLEGTLTLEVAGQIIPLQAQQGYELPPTVRHQVFNRSDRPVEFLVISQPPSHGDREA